MKNAQSQLKLNKVYNLYKIGTFDYYNNVLEARSSEFQNYAQLEFFVK